MRITIIGLGLIGGSLGLALHRSKINAEIIGHDLDHSVAQKARRLGAIDRAEWNLPASVEKSELVILATPVGEMEKLLAQIAQVLPQNCFVTDVASTKQKVIEWADNLLPDHVSFVGGHPMAGKETPGIEAAQADLFDGSTYCIIPSRKATSEAFDVITAMVSAIGATPFYLEAAEHDSFAAAVSHIPFLAAASLVNMVAGAPTWSDMSKLASSGFRDTTRLASGDVQMHGDICRTNRESIIRWLEAYIAQLTAFRDTLASDGKAIDQFFQAARQVRDALTSRSEYSVVSDMPGSSESFRQMFFGGRRQIKDPPKK